jgi:nicotinamide mononucleotide adenylyltransferase
MSIGTFTNNYYKPRFRTLENYKTDRLKVPNGFNQAVMDRFKGKTRPSSSYVSMVRRGIRKNDAVLMAIIEVDHNWNEMERERLKKY